MPLSIVKKWCGVSWAIMIVLVQPAQGAKTMVRSFLLGSAAGRCRKSREFTIDERWRKKQCRWKCGYGPSRGPDAPGARTKDTKLLLDRSSQLGNACLCWDCTETNEMVTAERAEMTASLPLHAVHGITNCRHFAGDWPGPRVLLVDES